MVDESRDKNSSENVHNGDADYQGDSEIQNTCTSGGIPIQSRKRKSFRQDQAQSMRSKRWKQDPESERELQNSQEKDHEIYEERVLRSSASFKKFNNVDQSYVINLSLLNDALQKCTHCNMGPLDLSNISKDVRAEGSCPVISISCNHCSKVNIIRASDHHRTGKRGPPTFDVNSRAGIGVLHAGIGHTHYTGLLGTLGLSALSTSSYRKRERAAGFAVESVAKRSCYRYEEEEKLQSKLEAMMA